MKRRAFVQALLIFLLLTGSWILVFLRFNRGDAPAPRDNSPLAEPSGQLVPEPADPPGLPPLLDETKPQPTAPDSWAEAIGLLQAAGSPAAMRAALADLEARIFALPPEQAIAFLLEFLESGADLRTGLAFQPGPDHSLVGAASLRALLLDWLHALDPALAARWAETELTSAGTALRPDVYAIHLRNYALGSADPLPARNAFLTERLQSALQYQPWLTQPSAAVAEMMDVAVHTGAIGLIPDFSRLIGRDAPQQLRRAAALTLERLVDRQPLQALSEILQQPGWPAGMEPVRAGYFARLDPNIDGAEALLDAYLTSPRVGREEAQFFLFSFPNLNRSFSHNLLSNQNFITLPGAAEAQLNAALLKVRAWRADPAMAAHRDTLDEVQTALLGRLGRPPSP